MRKWLVAAAALGLLLMAYGAQPRAAPPPPVPAVVDGIPVHAVAWNRPLPYVSRPLYINWRTVAPGTFKISTRSAVQTVLRYWWPARDRIKAIYVQAAGLRGLQFLEPFDNFSSRVVSAYVVELVGPTLNLGGAPAPITPPKEDFDIFWINGRTGTLQPGVGGSWPLTALVPNAVPPRPVYDLLMTSTVYKIEPVGFSDVLHWYVISGHLNANPATGCVLAYDLRDLRRLPTVVLVPDVGDLRITGFLGDRLVYVRSTVRGMGAFHLGSTEITWMRP